uniref:C2H2-type domain-containing protein n=1 Tax=Palpitomonas bilix TaxID=652834 RepID=A0A7S3D1A2_9EUKA|mmetsp:Transcript_18148/g.45298  ORF Transcript_18148/g.45298 Transcript_18148/m.45298 type:complete len:188 (+) Transcript_18148:781-1344(+)
MFVGGTKDWKSLKKMEILRTSSSSEVVPPPSCPPPSPTTLLWILGSYTAKVSTFVTTPHMSIRKNSTRTYIETCAFLHIPTPLATCTHLNHTCYLFLHASTFPLPRSPIYTITNIALAIPAITSHTYRSLSILCFIRLFLLLFVLHCRRQCGPLLLLRCTLARHRAARHLLHIANIAKERVAKCLSC